MSKKVLIVEDEPDVAKILGARFQAAGFETKHVLDALQAIKETHLFLPDVIILDLMLPAGGGWGVLKNIKLSTQVNLIPVIVYTGMQNEDRKKEVEALGIDAYFQKPFDIQKIVEKAEELIGSSAKPAEVQRKFKKRILIVDDDKGTAISLKMFVEMQKIYEVETAYDGFEAGEKFLSFKPDLVLLDIMMPGLDGYKICSRIRSNPQNKNVKIIFISATIDDEALEKIKRSGADDYLAKPFDIKELKERILKFLAL